MRGEEAGRPTLQIFLFDCGFYRTSLSLSLSLSIYLSIYLSLSLSLSLSKSYRV